MSLSVIIPAYGRTELLIRCIHSLGRTLQGDLDYTVCVIDDGSGIDEAYVRDKAQIDYPLEWISFPSNRGRSAARNEGIRATSGDIIVFLDSDMEASKDFLSAHLLCHEKHLKTAAVGRIIWPHSGGFMNYISARGVRKLADGDTVPPWYFVTGNASVPRSELPADAPFDETLPVWGGEDLDLGMRLHSTGINFVSVPEAVSYHNFEGTLRQHVERTRLYGTKALPVLIGRYPDLYHVVRLDMLDSPAGRFLVNSSVFYPLYVFARLFNFSPLPSKLYDYLTFAAYARGWLEGNKP